MFESIPLLLNSRLIGFNLGRTPFDGLRNGLLPCFALIRYNPRRVLIDSFPPAWPLSRSRVVLIMGS